MNERLDELQRRLGPGARRAEPLSRQASSRIGGAADLFFVARSREALVSAVAAAEALSVPWQLIGSASNLLISDDGVAGLVVKVATSGARIVYDEALDHVLVEVEAGTMYAAVARQMSVRGYGGLEWAINVPGTVGAAVVNNSGAFGSSTAEHLAEALLFDPTKAATVHEESGDGPSFDAAPVSLLRASLSELGLTYRNSRLKRGDLRAVVVSATFTLIPEPAEVLRARMAEAQATRRATQPAGYSIGSMFANPTGDSAGRLIDVTGLKGHRVGDVEVSEQHANFFLNRGGATARDVQRLMEEVQDAVWRRWRVHLMPEVQRVGRWDPSELPSPGQLIGGAT